MRSTRARDTQKGPASRWAAAQTAAHCLCALSAVWWLTACGEPPAGEETAPDGAGGGQTAAVAGSGGANASSSNGAGAGAGPSSSSAGGASHAGDLGTLVVLGDSISDGGGEGPFYVDVLHAALEAHYAKPIQLENHAQAGTTTLFLDGQIGGLPAELPGPVAVVITSGGNNMQYNVIQVLLDADQTARDRMGEHIDGALTSLLAPDRFGVGVEVEVYEANVYDASDGEGNFGSSGCAMPLDAPNGTVDIFARWNTVIEDTVAAHGQVLIDLHGHFAGHGFNQPPPGWYAPDCVHPNSAGHAEIAALALAAITAM